MTTLDNFIKISLEEFHALTASVDEEKLHAAADLILESERRGGRLHITGIGNQAIVKLHRMGIPNVLITLGERGCVFSNGKESFKSKSVDCGKVVDPTAAGDSFIGAFCTAAASGVPVEEALRFANCAAGITVSRMGAQKSLPTLQEVLIVMKANGFNRTPFQKLQKGS